MGKRKDLKGRILRNGETQVKSGLYKGRYRYAYYINGKQKNCYSWKLENYDPLPAGKRECESLRSQEKKIQREMDLSMGICVKKRTVGDLVVKYVDMQRRNPVLRESTKAGYNATLKHILDSDIADKRADQITYSDAVLYIQKLGSGQLSYSTVSHIFAMLKAAYNIALGDHLVDYNPFLFGLRDHVVDNSKKRIPFFPEERESLIKFIKADRYYNKYADIVEFLFFTGLRISEFCGLTTDCIDFDNRMIRIDKQLQKNKGNLVIVSPKTEAGIRKIPLTDRAFTSLKQILKKRNKKQEKVKVAGISGFLIFDEKNNPRYGSQLASIFANIWNKYKKTNKVREGLVFTPHICRHTFATEMAMQGMHPDILKTILGHADYATTSAIYTHIPSDALQDELVRLGYRQ